MDLMLIGNELIESKKPWLESKLPDQPGVYAIFLNPKAALGGFKATKNGMIYIGESGNLGKRGHFESGKTGFSTLRRSIGAIKKRELQLVAVPRSEGSSNSSFRFEQASEERLTDWMLSSLKIGFATVANLYKEVEKDLILHFQPVLNLKYWKNPKKQEITRLRNVCREEAYGPL